MVGAVVVGACWRLVRSGVVVGEEERRGAGDERLAARVVRMCALVGVEQTLGRLEVGRVHGKRTKASQFALVTSAAAAAAEEQLFATAAALARLQTALDVRLHQLHLFENGALDAFALDHQMAAVAGCFTVVEHELDIAGGKRR